MNLKQFRYRFLLPLFLLVMVTGGFWGCEKDDVIPPADESGLLTGLSYGDDPRQTLDVALPAGRDATTPVVLILHGGAWTTGDNGLEYVRRLRSAMADTGLVAVAIDFRRPTGDFRDQIADIREAIGYVQDMDEAWGINATKFGLLGFDSGAHLALLYGHKFTDERVRAVVSISAATDLSDTLFLSNLANQDLLDDLEAFMGRTYTEDSTEYADASPYLHLGPVPTLFIHGFSDLYFPYYQTLNMYEQLAGLGAYVDTTIFDTRGHNLWNEDEVESQIMFESKAWMSFYLSF